jgi:GTP-binding protein
LLSATKVDRLAKARRKPRLQQLARSLELPPAAVVPFSATEHIGIDEVWEALLDVVGARS